MSVHVKPTSAECEKHIAPTPVSFSSSQPNPAMKDPSFILLMRVYSERWRLTWCRSPTGMTRPGSVAEISRSASNEEAELGGTSSTRMSSRNKGLSLLKQSNAMMTASSTRADFEVAEAMAPEIRWRIYQELLRIRRIDLSWQENI